tara:strand:+ start:127 stop:393 length:267 start_codon:yes stop_codon:yes gene_type:complete
MTTRQQMKNFVKRSHERAGQLCSALQLTKDHIKELSIDPDSKKRCVKTNAGLIFPQDGDWLVRYRNGMIFIWLPVVFDDHFTEVLSNG